MHLCDIAEQSIFNAAVMLRTADFIQIDHDFLLYTNMPSSQRIFMYLFVSTDFDKKAKKETCPLLEQFLCHIAKTGETM